MIQPHFPLLLFKQHRRRIECNHFNYKAKAEKISGNLTKLVTIGIQENLTGV
jgi:hypothetical protein